MKKNGHGIKVFSSIPVFLMMCLFFNAFVTGCTKTELIESKEDLEVTDKAAPTVVSVDPENNTSTVSLTARPSVIFSETMNEETITSASFTLKKGNAELTGTVTYSGKIATFIPSAPFEANTVYTCTITTSVKDVAGNALAVNYTWNFKTVPPGDVTAPTVLSVLPANNATSVLLTVNPSATFSEAMNGATLTSASFTVKKGSTALTGTVAYSGTTATFDPSASLEANTVYTCTISTSAKDASGNALAANYTWSFTTGTLADVTAPTVFSVAPSANATSVAVGIEPTVTFSEAMSSASITSSTFTLKQGTITVAGSVSYSGTTATFTPSAALAGNTVYTVTITNAVKDAAGNAMASNYIWSFTTIAAAAGKSFSADVVPILNLCNTCHNHNWTPSTTPSIFHANLVQSGHINTTTPTNGKIYNKMSGGHPSSTVSSAQKTTVLTWIKEGSKNN